MQLRGRGLDQPRAGDEGTGQEIRAAVSDTVAGRSQRRRSGHLHLPSVQQLVGECPLPASDLHGCSYEVWEEENRCNVHHVR